MAEQDVAVAEAEEEEQAFEAPERGSAEELLDAGAHSELDPMRHSAAHVMAEAVLDLFPGTKLGIGPAIEDGFYYDFDLPRPLTTDDLAAIEAAHGRVGRGRPPVRASASCPPEEGRAFFAETGPAVQGRDPRRPGGEGRARRHCPCRRRSSTSTGPFIDLCRGPHVESTGKIGPFKLLAVSGAYWRGDQKRPSLQRDLRHGVGDAGGARPLPVAARGGQEARPPQARASSSTCSRSTTCRPGAAFWHPKGWTLYQTAAQRDARDPGAARLPGDLHAAARRTRSCGSSRATGSSTARTCSWSRPRTRRSASSR